MYNTGQFVSLLLQSFSFDRQSLRYIHPRRIFRLVIFVPILLLHVCFSRLFLLIDEIIFRGYRKMNLDKALFIIGLPRSGTTHLYKLLAADGQMFHCQRLWELAMAPSITQKYLLLGLNKADNLCGGPLKKLLIKIDETLFSEFRGIHDIGIFKPEEDEALFMYNLSSIFLIYLFPEVASFEVNLNFDEEVSAKIRRRNLSFYKRLVQRHKYVFDRANERYYLSKNPTFCSRISSVAEQFKQAIFVIPDRSPIQTIPSTISLNAHIYRVFCKLPSDYPLEERTTDQVLRWHHHIHSIQQEKLTKRSLVIDYQELVKQPAECLFDIYRTMGINKSKKQLFEFCQRSVNPAYVSPHQYPKTLGLRYTKEKLSLTKSVAGKN